MLEFHIAVPNTFKSKMLLNLLLQGDIKYTFICTGKDHKHTFRPKMFLVVISQYMG